MTRSDPSPCVNIPGLARPHETNQRFKFFIENGQNALNVAFDLPTQMGLDSSDPLAEGEVGRVGWRWTRSLTWRSPSRGFPSIRSAYHSRSTPLQRRSWQCILSLPRSGGSIGGNTRHRPKRYPKKNTSGAARGSFRWTPESA